MCTGSQGEPSSIVGRLSAGTNRQFDLKPGDTVVLSSHPIPGNEETISKTINRLLRSGAKVIHDGIAPIHVSGHAAQEEQKLLINLVRPKHFMPIHGELRQLRRHAELAQQVGRRRKNIIIRRKRSGRGTGWQKAHAWRTHPRRLRFRHRRIHRRHRPRCDEANAVSLPATASC
jgi:mRNA degradation ribonuclease J1/J2